MAKFSIVTGTTSQSVNIFIQDSSSTTGAGKSGLVAANLTCYYSWSGANAGSVAVSLSDLATLATAYTSGGLKEIDSTNMKGWYRLDLPNAALVSGKGNTVGFAVQDSGAHNVTPTPFEIELTAVNNQDGVHFGLTSLPNAAAGANTGLPVVGTQVPNATAGASGGLGTVDSTNSIKIQTPAKKNTALNNFAFVMLNTAGVPQTGLTVTSTVSIDGGAFASTVNAVVEIAQGWYKINLAAADVNGTNIALRFSAASAKDTDILLLMLP